MHKIGWCKLTFNPIFGCWKIAKGCLNCYACRLAATRLRHHPLYRGVAKMIDGEPSWLGGVSFDPKPLERIAHLKKPRRIFMCDMSDWMHEGVTDEQRDVIMAYTALYPQHTYLFLTKRPERQLKYFDLSTDNREEAIAQKMLEINPMHTIILARRAHHYLSLANVQLGYSASTQAELDAGIVHLLKTPASVRYLSLEPLLGLINLGLNTWFDTGYIEGSYSLSRKRVCESINWVVVGCESGVNRRKTEIIQKGSGVMHQSQVWIESIVEQCQAANVPVWVKQMEINGKVEHDVAKFPKHLQYRELP